MDNDIPDMNQHLWMLVVSLQAGAMQQMGKVASPISGEIERNLEAARATIDTLVMLEGKTKGNLSDDESKFLSSVLYQLRLNFVDESKKGDKAESASPSAGESADPESENPDERNDTNEGNSGESDGKRSDD